ncbi:ParB/RepB/Spo0J family partition protein [Persicobacter psychrovividus]|uniref:ParB/Sulfiredoxin domain-containing protein n=1 Tax=Persicobacter psychrovividus TaxID=387638 RepID=A0ABM7VIC0_9BACT|nr:hypothetical protein PEPS_30040 [Persicobacter psychrovividus]
MNFLEQVKQGTGSVFAHHEQDQNPYVIYHSTQDISVHPDFEAYIQKPTPEEQQRLKESIQAEGVRDPLVVWLHEGEKILLDGHNRLGIIKALDLDRFPTVEKHFSNVDEAKEWMLINQLGRRNLNSKQMKYYRGLLYNRMKNENGGIRRGANFSGKNLPTEKRVSEYIAQEHGVSEKTVRNDALYQIGLDKLEAQEAGAKEAILLGFRKLSDAKVIAFAKDQPLSAPQKKESKSVSKLPTQSDIEKAIELLMLAKQEQYITQPQLQRLAQIIE